MFIYARLKRGASRSSRAWNDVTIQKSGNQTSQRKRRLYSGSRLLPTSISVSASESKCKRSNKITKPLELLTKQNETQETPCQLVLFLSCGTLGCPACCLLICQHGGLTLSETWPLKTHRFCSPILTSDRKLESVSTGFKMCHWKYNDQGGAQSR